MTATGMPEIVKLPLDQITPYPNNPRSIPREAIAKVRESLEKYGYHQPIVVDREHVIVVGHTRYAALQQMGVEEIEVYIFQGSAEKAREYRVIDNRTGEMSEWDQASLIMELREFDTQLMDSFFPEIDLEIGSTVNAIKDVTQDDIDRATEKAQTVRALEPTLSTTVQCPSCFATFEVKTATLPGLSQLDLDVIAAGRAAADGGRAE